MYVINKLILQDQKVISELQDLLFNKEKVLQNFCKMDGLIHSENSIQIK